MNRFSSVRFLYATQWSLLVKQMTYLVTICHCEPVMCGGERESYNVAVRVELERVLEANGVIVHRQNGSEHLPLLGNNVICQNTIV